MQAGEKNIKLDIETFKDLTGSTLREYVIQGPADLTPRKLAMAIDVLSMTIATRLTLETDFPVGGNYVTQLEVTYSDGRFLRSPRKLLFIGADFTDC